MTNDNVFPKKNQRPIRSYVLRQGRMTPAQSKALQDLWPVYGIDQEGMLEMPSPNVLEIGFGMGKSLIQQAKAHPEIYYLGIEVHKPGVGSLLHLAQKENLSNIRVFCKDAIEVLEKNIPDYSLDKIQIFFPDPWPKKRHYKRRLIQIDFIKLIDKKLKSSGLLHIATDWEEYAEFILDVINKTDLFKIIVVQHDRPSTKFEARGRKLGHIVRDLVFCKK